ncbi:MAG: NAD(P)-binding protein [Planctomycetaceae bacterium]|nr:NAD(P)-binding protein [Planctomycetaceae bacterium]
MPLRLTNLEMPVEAPEQSLLGEIAQRLSVSQGDVLSWRILRKSLDARSRDRLKFVYTVEASLHDETGCLSRVEHAGQLQPYEPPVFDDPEPGPTPAAERPVIVGSGPAGLLAGYYLAAKGYRPLILERGRPVKERVPAIRSFDRGGEFQRENNYLFGEGGAGCFSDGKLTCRITGADVNWVLDRFVECGGRESLVYENRPHLGSNRLPLICRNFRRKIEALGGEYRFSCQMEQIDIADGQVRGLGTSSGYIRTSHVILGIGHSARDSYEMLLAAGVPLRARAFQLGLRIEHPQANINRHKYSRPEYLDLLGAADYTLVAKGQRDLYTFCMCAGGLVIPSVSEPEMFCTNGMSNSRHDTPFANSGLVVTIQPEEFGSTHPLAGVELQRKYESAAFRLAGRDYLCPIQAAGDFLAGRSPDQRKPPVSSYERGVVPLPLDELLPPVIVKAIREGLPLMDRRWRGDFLRDASLVGPEMRGSSPVRIDRDPASRQCPEIAGLYPVGEGAGYAGGIVTAAVDGLRSAREVVRQFAVPEN